ncbi:MAG: hypothetical protein LWX07_10830 [Bacteroidetes bacterium]|nr:hypothetical protein [Bacteroidota bacterium]
MRENYINQKRHRPLLSVAHNFGNSLVSLMNYIGDDHFVGHLLKQARKTKCSRLEVDILKREFYPKELLTEPIITSLNNWMNWFPKMVEDNGASMDFVKSAALTIEFDLHNSRIDPISHKYIEYPYVCNVVITDDKGKVYCKKQEEWWSSGEKNLYLLREKK